MKMNHYWSKVVLALLFFCTSTRAQNGNHADRLEWFRDQGFGLFIHWGVDSQLGSVISHSLVGASDDYVERYFRELPKTFDPHNFNPGDWAVLARLAGVRYVVFTAKHHSGFCMFQTGLSDFGLRQTAFHRDITREVLDSFRAQGIAPGLYFSPDDFFWLQQHHVTINRDVPQTSPEKVPELLAYDQAQVRELLTGYGPVSVIFFDGPAGGLRELAWKLQPDIVVTRGALETPEQYIPGIPLEGPWEANLTMGTQWQYKPTNETYKSGTQLIKTLVETRAKGGNLLLNIGPKPDGTLAIEQEARLREIALWMFVNGESIYAVRPWVVTNEGNVWFTRKKNTDTVFAIVSPERPWKYGEWNDVLLHSVRATEKTEVSVLGQSGKILEYRPDVTPKVTWSQEADGLHLRAMRAQRIYNDRTWPNPVVLKITNAQAGLTPPAVETAGAKWDPAAKTVKLTGVLRDLGKTASVEVGFEYQRLRGLDVNERNQAWHATPLTTRSSPGEFSVTLSDWEPGETYSVRAVVQHPLVKIYGRDVRLVTK